MGSHVIVVGAGITGLVCARRLHQAGHSVTIVEATDRPGGRLKTDTIDGYRVDRGFQVYFDAYPHARHELDYSRLNLRRFEPGALVWDGKRFHMVHRENLVHMAVSTWLPLRDKFRLFEVTQDIESMSDSDIWSMEDQTVESFLRQCGFTEAFLDRFARPFFGGVLLDRSLQTSCRPFVFYWKMMLVGNTVIPMDGIEAIPAQIAADLPAEAFRFYSRVAKVAKEGNKAVGVELANGELIRGDSVVIATDAPSAAAITGIGTVNGSRGETTVSFAAPTRPINEPILGINALDRGMVNHMAVMSNPAPARAPQGKFLVSATMLSIPDEADEYVAKTMQYELQQWFPKANVEDWQPLRVDRISYAQMPQVVGVSPVSGNETDVEGLFLAGEFTTYAGIDGAIKSGQQCASAILRLASLEPTPA